MDTDHSDMCPVYDGQDLSAFTVLMVHCAAAQLGLTHEGANVEDDMRAQLQEAAPDILALVDKVMEAYQIWIESINDGQTGTPVERALAKQVENLRAELAAAVYAKKNSTAK